MAKSDLFAAIIGALIVSRWIGQLWLERLNRRHVLAHAKGVPDAFRGLPDEATYARSIQYTRAKSRFNEAADTWNTVVLALLLYSGVLPLAHSGFTGRMGDSAWAAAAFLLSVGVVLALTGLPFDWYAQLRLEERFGFNTTTLRLWCVDRLKALLLLLIAGYPLLVLVLKLVEWTGRFWWLRAWGCVVAFQLLMFVIAPVLILPWFNKFTPMPEGSLRTRLLALGQRTGFTARNIQVMDGSRRSRHSNAFFTGFGRQRKIVLFDTLIEQLSDAETEAVLAHEIGHYKYNHVLKTAAASAVGSLAGFALIGWLARQPWFLEAFGFTPGDAVLALLLFGLLSGVAGFWLSPLWNGWSRRFEYQADRYAATATGDVAPLIGALRKLAGKNLSNLTPHPWYSGFYYSHPTLFDREQALGKSSARQRPTVGRSPPVQSDPV